MSNDKIILRVWLLMICLFGFGSVVFAQTKTESPISKETTGGETYINRVSEADFAETPSWKSEEGEPPISLSRAVSIAKSNLPRFVSGVENFQLQRIVLNTFGKDKWFYSVVFSCPDTVCRSLPIKQFSIIVKMDGNISEPKKVIKTK